MSFTIWTFFAALAIAAGVGMLTGIFGAGGGFILTPALMILLKIDPAIAVGTGLATILCSSSLSLIKRRGSGTLDWKLAGLLCVGALAGVIIGKQIMLALTILPPRMLRSRLIPTADFFLLWFFFGMLLAIAWFLWFDYRQTKGRAPAVRIGLLHRLKIPPMLRFKSLEAPWLSAPVLLLLGMTVGILTGLLGIGGGVIWLPALVYLVGQRTARAAGTSLILVWISALFGAGLYLKAGCIDLPLWLILSVGGLFGAWIGTPVGLKISGPRLRLSFIFVVGMAALLVGCKLAAMFLC